MTERRLRSIKVKALVAHHCLCTQDWTLVIGAFLALDAAVETMMRAALEWFDPQYGKTGTRDLDWSALMKQHRQNRGSDVRRWVTDALDVAHGIANGLKHDPGSVLGGLTELERYYDAARDWADALCRGLLALPPVTQEAMPTPRLGPLEAAALAEAMFSLQWDAEQALVGALVAAGAEAPAGGDLLKLVTDARAGILKASVEGVATPKLERIWGVVAWAADTLSRLPSSKEIDLRLTLGHADDETVSEAFQILVVLQALEDLAWDDTLPE